MKLRGGELETMGFLLQFPVPDSLGCSMCMLGG